ncbi:hypothetical protein ACKWTF_013849 [Chironomus riparius]
MTSKIAFLFETTSLHGFRHLVHQQKIGWKKSFARTFWTCFIAISFLLMVRMLRSTIRKGTISTSINLDTSYRDWDNAFPAVSLCLTKGRSTAPIKASVGTSMLREDGEEFKLSMRHFRVMQSLLFVNYQEPTEGISIETCLEMNTTCGMNFDYQRKKLIPHTCEGVMDRVFYMGEEMNCSDIFIPMETEYGTCFVANSLYNKRTDGQENLENFDDLPLRFSNNDYRERSFEFHYRENDFLLYKLFIHTPEELPNGKLESVGLRKIGGMTKFAIKTTEFLNQDDVKYESIEARECRFPFERFDTLNLPYSLNYCRYLKRIQRELETCNCTFPLGLSSNHSMNECGVTNFQCLHDLATATNLEMKTEEGIKRNIGECLVPSCVSMEIVKVGESDFKFGSTTTGSVKIEVVNMPTLRYVRRVTFTKLDMIGESMLNFDYSPNLW